MDALLSYCSKNPDLEIQDIFKYLYQSTFGCEHFAENFHAMFERIQRERPAAQDDSLPEVELLGGNYARIHLKLLNKGLSPETLCKLFLLSAGRRENESKSLTDSLSQLAGFAKEGLVPFSETEIQCAVTQWSETGFQPCHHSEHFKSICHPSYRVVEKKYVPLLPVLIGIDKVLQSRETVHIAIDGRCTAGKTTVSALLSSIYDCNVFHLDDFFLRPGQRTPERLHMPGENVDHERFLKEVLIPSTQKHEISYIKYDCHKQALDPPVSVKPRRINICEGTYSLHPSLCGYYDLKVFLDVSPEQQRERILSRSRETAERFFSEWIPLEDLYFQSFDIRKKADLVIDPFNIPQY